jgi:hypothetical protein
MILVAHVRPSSLWDCIPIRRAATLLNSPLSTTRAGDFVTATQRIYHAPGAVSFIDLPVVPR